MGWMQNPYRDFVAARKRDYASLTQREILGQARLSGAKLYRWRTLASVTSSEKRRRALGAPGAAAVVSSCRFRLQQRSNVCHGLWYLNPVCVVDETGLFVGAHANVLQSEALLRDDR